MKQLHKPFLFSLFILIFPSLSAQIFPGKNYPQNYFIYPVKDVRVSLAGNFGELRSNHFHMGLDCRTDQAVNKTTVAAAEGYISRVSVTPGGYGRAIYINHPNGLTTVYGHLNKFYPELENYLREQQYARETWVITLEFSPDLFPVKKGQFIAWSGSTGGSGGPHVHFEIRDTKTGKVLNPLLFNMPIPDNIPPTITALYMYDRCKSTYSKTPVRIPIKWTGTKFVATESVITIPTYKISFGVTATDKQGGSPFSNGIYEGILYFDNQAQSGFQLDSISYLDTRYMNAHIDYKTKASGGSYIQHLSRLPGYPEFPEGVHKDILNDGVIELDDREIHPVKIVIKDTHGNSRTIELNVRRGFIRENGEGESERNDKEFMPMQVNVYEDGGVQVYLDDKALYDSVQFSIQSTKTVSRESVSPVYTVLSGLVPVHSSVTVRIKPDKVVNNENRVLVKRSWNGSSEVVKATKEGEWFTGKFRAFGDFELITDEEPPVISGGFVNNANLSRARTISFSHRDNNSQVKNFRAELDGKWLMFTNDKGRNFIYTFDEHCPRGKHELKVYLEDEAGNSTEKILHFTR